MRINIGRAGLESLPRHVLAGILICFLGFPIVIDSQPKKSEAQATPACAGDCDGDGTVTVDEIVLIVNVILGDVPLASCPIYTEFPDVEDVVLAIDAALGGCPPGATPTPSATETPFPTLTPVVFRAAEGSRIVYSEGDGSAPIDEPLSGAFSFRLVEQVPQFFNLNVTAVELLSPQFTVVAQSEGQAGSVRMGSSCASQALINLRVLINDRTFGLNGIADIAGCPPDIATIEPFEVCSAVVDPSECDEIHAGTRFGYSLEIIPVLDSMSSTATWGRSLR
jgi:hypothetical protein